MKLILDNFTMPNLQKSYVGRHWSKRAAEARTVQWIVRSAVMTQKIKPIKKYPIGLEVNIFVKGMKRDLDSYLMVKEVIDGLRYAKILANDSPKFINNLIVEVVLAEENKVIVESI